MRRAVLGAVAGALLLSGCGTGGGGGGDSARPGPKGSAAGKGGSWKIVHVDRKADSELRGVAAPAADDIWATGTVRAHGDDYLLRYDGSSWRRSPLPAELGGSVTQTRLEATGARNVWLVGMDSAQGGPRFARWDGSRWHGVPQPPIEAAVDVEVLAADDVWALEGERAAHWDGSRWTLTRLPGTAKAVDGTSGSVLWAVGFRDSGPGVGGAGGELTQTAAARWDARAGAWEPTPTPAHRFADPVPPEAGASLDGVLAVSEDEVWAYGTHGYNHGETENEPPEEHILLRWDGTRWRQQPGAGTDPCLSGTPVAHDGAGGILFERHRYRAPDGACSRIPFEKLPATGEITARGKQQLWFDQVARVPGSKRFVGAGQVSVMQSGNPLTMAAVAVWEP
ncbi:hypothetical protein GPA10_02080 [Streptomyces sp. p1417]|uniref:Uncharacterized protein n=1 Tax=Streptomyces typhae TaxID=2681492 RepID=A0A6L6WPG9_9ACTN|nr:hypothetical protein [Streptomyces typhae]MVO83579.1 hypothetical protein [Streptomyces typhae]